MFLVYAPKLNGGRGKTHIANARYLGMGGMKYGVLCGREFSSDRFAGYEELPFDERRVDCKRCVSRLVLVAQRIEQNTSNV